MCGRYYIDSQTGYEIIKLLKEIDRRLTKNAGQLSNTNRPPTQLPNTFLEQTKKAGASGFADIHPKDPAAVLYQRGPFVLPESMTWGFPGFDKNKLIINARAESAADKKIFRESIRHQRCIIPAKGFYEWNSRKEKSTFLRGDGRILLMGGCFKLFGSEPRFVILTAPADKTVSPVHHRMPLIFEPSEAALWICDDSFAQHILQSTADRAGNGKTNSVLQRKQEYEQLTLFT